MRAVFLAAASVAAMAAAAPAEAQSRLLRFPDIHGDQVVFTHGGDLWLASTEGGQARRLTSHPGLELFARFSPDGSQIAFTGQYGGDEQVFVIDAEGGEPRQLTHYPANGPLPARWGYDNQVYGWTPEGDAVVFRSLRDGFDLTDSRLYTASVEGGLPEALPMPVSGAGVLSPDGSQALYSPLFRDFRTWKRYEGGWAQDLYVFDMDTFEATNITDHPRTDRDPMWIGEQIYFVSDRDDFLNLYRYDPASGETTQLTSYENADVRWASDDGESRIIYELGGVLRVHDLATGEDAALDITVGDDGARSAVHIMSASDYMQDFAASPDGVRVAVSARGDVFSVPVEDGVTRNLTDTAGVNERELTWSPNGDLIAYISDETGEEELYVRDQAGIEPARQLTSGSSIRYYDPVFSPDGEWLAFGDAGGRILVVSADGGAVQEVYDDPGFAQHDFGWSPDSRWLTFSAQDEGGAFRSVYVWNRESGESVAVTGELFNEFSPAFSTDGQHLFFVADRSFAPQIGSFEWNYVVDRESYLYALALTDDAPNPFLPQNDEVAISSDDEEDESDDDNGDEEELTVEIDFDGLADRVIRFPLDAGNYGGLAAVDGHVLYFAGGPFVYGGSSGVSPTLNAFNIEERESFEIASGLSGYSVAAGGEHVIVRSENSLNRYAISDGAEAESVDLGHMEVRRVPAAEYEQMFGEVWRRFRDYFYVENMHGYDWDAIRTQYEPLVADVAHRADLNYLMGEMIGELNVSHAYVAGGDLGLPDRPDTALLGARLELDGGGYRFVDIFEGHNEEPRYRSPLTEVGVNVEEGDYLLAINGRTLSESDNPYALLAGLGDGLVELRVADDASGSEARTVVIDPITDEDNLLYLRWVEANRAIVAEATDGRVGYLHIPDMGASGIYEFIKWYYGQMRMEGLVIDVRGNGGGNVSQMLINRLSRELLFTGYARQIENAESYPNQMFLGEMVAILDEDSASDGDIFPAAFREAELGPLIGQRSWGGVIGITSHGALLDGGSVFVPQFGFADAEGQWTIEGYGVDPDIEVEFPPSAQIAGEDPQLARAIEDVMARLPDEAQPVLPPRPEPPVRTPGSEE